MRRLLPGVVVLLLACGGDDLPSAPTAPSIDAAFTGIWRLRTVNGQALPYVLDQIGTTKTELSGGSISTASGGTFTSQMEEVTTSPGVLRFEAHTDGGLVTVAGNTATFHFIKAGTTGIGTLSHDTLTVVEGSLSLALTR